MAQDYFGDHLSAMDRGYYHQLDSFGTIYHPAALHENEGGAKTKLGPTELGQSANPFQNQLLSLQARIRGGASSIELSFSGAGKGSQQQSTPEMYGADEREAMRALAEYNRIKTSTHASFGVSGLAGFGREGFDKRMQHQVVEEVRKAVDFASQATAGGAIVVHSGEWERPISETPWTTQEFKKIFGDQPAFLGYADEPVKAEMHVVDKRTGQFITGIRKDQEIYEPKWVLAKDYEKYSGKKLSHKDLRGNSVEKYDDDDYVDVDGNKLNAEESEELFRRMPFWDEKNMKFETQQLTWDELQKRTQRYNEKHASQKPITVEELYAKVQIDNAILQARGSSIFHGQHYDDLKKARDKLQKALEFAKKLDKNLPEKDKWQLLRQQKAVDEYDVPEHKAAIDEITERIDGFEKQMRHIHESSSAADVQAKTLLARKENIETMEEYGLKQSGQALAELGIYAMQKSKQMLENVKQHGGDAKKYEKIYIAPENVFPTQYGSHPDELIKIVESGRETMAKELLSKNMVKTRDDADRMAKDHIKSTIDVGHLNMWKTHMKRKDNETEVQFNKRFEGWAMDKLETMHKKGILGHFHVADNMGFQDEHLTPGQGNAPIRAFVKKLEELGYKDFIIEQSGTNDANIMGETWSYLGALAFKPGAQGQFGNRFTDIHWRHAASYAPPNYIVGAYVPSNEWTLWSQVPLE